MNEKTLHELWDDALEEASIAFVFDDVGDDFAEGAEGFAVARGWWTRLEADFGDDQGLCTDRGEGFGEGAED